MSDIPVQLVVVIFETPGSAEAALDIVKDKKLEGIQGAVAIRKDAEGVIHYHDVGPTPVKGAAGGVILGALIGVLSGGIGLALGTLGGLIGGLVGRRKRDDRMPTEQVNQIVARMAPSSSALLAVLESPHLAEFEKAVEPSAADMLTSEVSEQLLEQLDEHRLTVNQALDEHLDTTQEEYPDR